ncbi:MAG: ubiquinol-cytochrome C chaperone family protein, partial [Pseudomonadota bacterium]|nr:ubiquinol-cytochrome C chaperone family protein [Pseudomonadota bacterium]
QDLFDLFFKDMDQAMREAGVGDMGVGKKVQKMVEAFYGRATAYDEVLDALPDTNREHMASGIYDILSRNLYPDAALSAQHEAVLNALATYVLSLDTHLAGVTLGDILSGRSFEAAPILKVAYG